ncbi:MAG: BolA/IbaG family iron-sulfur metabolism protein [Gammaproteobacteria bacterium]|nr:BolA/IbaG family iron-sulfur metabolism protein [Gammaproteobacteria bacterium]
MDLQSAIESRLADRFRDAAFSVEVSGNHAQISIATSQFEGLTPVKRQQLVYGCLTELIRTGELHAVTIKAKTAESS